MAQQYGTVKCDVLTFTSGTTGNETDVSVAVSGFLLIIFSPQVVVLHPYI